MEYELDLNYLKKKDRLLFQKIYFKNKSKFINLINRLYEKTNKSIYWSVNTIFSRNNNLSGLYMNYCYIRFIKEINKTNKIKYIYTQSYKQKKILNHYFKGKVYYLNPTLKDYLKNNILVINLKNFISNFIYSIYFIFYFFYFKKFKINNSIVLIETFILDSMFKNNKFEDRYYTNLEKFSDLKKENLFFLPIFPKIEDLKKFIKFNNFINYKRNFLLPFLYLKFSDYVKGLFSFLFVSHKSLGKVNLNGLDISFIIKDEILSNANNRNSFLGILSYFLFKRLKQNNIEFDKIIDWYENSPLDKGFYYGVNKYYPKTKTLGYQGFILSHEFNFYFKPEKIEIKNKLSPKVVGIQGDKIRTKFKSRGENIKLQLCPAFRYQHLYNFINIRKKNKIKNILIALPIGREEIKKIVNILNDFFLKYGKKNYNFILSMHPSYNFEKDNHIIKKINKNVSATNKNFIELKKKVDLLISGSSTTCLEALALKIPVITVNSSSNIFEDIVKSNLGKDISISINSAKDLSFALERIKYLDKKIQKQHKKILHGFFCKMTKEKVNEFIT